MIRKQIEAVYGEVAAEQLLRLNELLGERDSEIERLKLIIVALIAWIEEEYDLRKTRVKVHGEIERLKGLLARAADALLPLSHPVKCGCNVCRLLDELRKAV